MNKKIVFFTSLVIAVLLYTSHSLMSYKLTSFVKVKGAAERSVVADKVYWNIEFVNAGNNIELLQEKNSKDIEVIRQFLLDNSFTEDEFKLGIINLNDLEAREYKDPNQKNRYILNQSISIETENIDKVEKIVSKMNFLIQKGISIKNSYGENMPIYIFSKLNDIKSEMIAEATRNARKSAEQFAKDSKSKIFKIKTADQGVFTILPKNSSVYMNELSSKEKQIRVVSTIEYWLK